MREEVAHDMNMAEAKRKDLSEQLQVRTVPLLDRCWLMRMPVVASETQGV